MVWLILASILAVTISLILRRHVRSSAAALGIEGEVIYAETGGDVEILISERYDLVRPARLHPGRGRRGSDSD